MGVKSDCNKFRGRRSPRITIIPLQLEERDWRIFRCFSRERVIFFFFFFVISRVDWKVSRFVRRIRKEEIFILYLFNKDMRRNIRERFGKRNRN